MSSRFTRLAVLAAALGATTVATAQVAASAVAPVAAAATAVPTTVSQVLIRGHAGGRLDLDAMRGEYTLADGRSLSVARRGRVLVAGVGQDLPQRLHEVAPGVHASADGALTLRFDQRANGLVAGVQLSEMRLR